MSSDTAESRVIHDTDMRVLLEQCSQDSADMFTLGMAADRAGDLDAPHLEAFLRWLMANEVKGFCFTGSRCYGTPREDSDFDWVLWVKLTHLDELRVMAEVECGKDYYDVSEGQLDTALRFGPVNVLVVTTPFQYLAWFVGTRRLLKDNKATGRKRTKEEACAEFEKQCKRVGLAGRHRPPN